MGFWKNLGIAVGATVFTVAVGTASFCSRDSLHNYGILKYRDGLSGYPRGEITLGIGDDVDLESNITIGNNGEYKGTVRLRLPAASVENIAVPSAAVGPQGLLMPSGKGRPAPAASGASRKPPAPITPGKYTVNAFRHYGNAPNQAWIDVDIPGDMDIAIPCKNLTPRQARALARDMRNADAIEVRGPPTGSYIDHEGRHWSVIPPSILRLIDYVEYDDLAAGLQGTERRLGRNLEYGLAREREAMERRLQAPKPEPPKPVTIRRELKYINGKPWEMGGYNRSGQKIWIPAEEH